MRYTDIKYPDTFDGLGVRVALYVQGCSRHCKGCHNPETWNFDGGYDFNDVAKANILKILSMPWVNGLSVLGGEPLEQGKELELFLKLVKECFPEKDIWLWTGYTYEDVKESHKDILQYVDVLVDGPYIESKKNISLAFRGSENQRIIKLKELSNE